MRITQKGQVTIPQAIREKLGLFQNTEVTFDVVGSSVRIRKARNGEGRGSRLIAHMRGRGKVKLTTDEIMSMTRG